MNEQDDEFWRRGEWHPKGYLPDDDLEPTAEEEWQMRLYQDNLRDYKDEMQRSFFYRHPFAVLGLQVCCLPLLALGALIGGFFLLLLILQWLS